MSGEFDGEFSLAIAVENKDSKQILG